MKKFLIVVLCVLALAPLIASAQVVGEGKAKEPATKLEAFLAKKGKIIVKDFYEIGKVAGKHQNNKIKFTALVVYEPGQETQKMRGVKIQIYENTSFLDLEEIESLSKAITYMLDLSEKWKGVNKEYTEVIFSTKDDFKIGFYQKGTEQTAFSSSGYIRETSCIFSSVQDLNSVKLLADFGLKLLSEK